MHETEPNDGLRYNNANHPPFPYFHWRGALDVPDDESSSSASPSSDAGSDSPLSDVDEDFDAADKPTNEDLQHKGYLIDHNRRPAVVSCPDPSKLRIEIIQQGKYKMATHKGQEDRPRSSTAPRKRFRWQNEEREDDGEVYVESD